MKNFIDYFINILFRVVDKALLFHTKKFYFLQIEKIKSGNVFLLTRKIKSRKRFVHKHFRVICIRYEYSKKFYVAFG